MLVYYFIYATAWKVKLYKLPCNRIIPHYLFFVQSLRLCDVRTFRTHSLTEGITWFGRNIFWWHNSYEKFIEKLCTQSQCVYTMQCTCTQYTEIIRKFCFVSSTTRLMFKLICISASCENVLLKRNKNKKLAHNAWESPTKIFNLVK